MFAEFAVSIYLRVFTFVFVFLKELLIISRSPENYLQADSFPSRQRCHLPSSFSHLPVLLPTPPLGGALLPSPVKAIPVFKVRQCVVSEC